MRIAAKVADTPTRKTWERKLRAVERARVKAMDDYYIAILEAVEAGLTQRDVSYILGNVGETSMTKYRSLGAEARDRRSGVGSDGPAERGANGGGSSTGRNLRR